MGGASELGLSSFSDRTLSDSSLKVDRSFGEIAKGLSILGGSLSALLSVRSAGTFSDGSKGAISGGGSGAGGATGRCLGSVSSVEGAFCSRGLESSVQPQKSPKIQNWVRARGPPAAVAPVAVPPAGSNPILDFWDYFWVVYGDT